MGSESAAGPQQLVQQGRSINKEIGSNCWQDGFLSDLTGMAAETIGQCLPLYFLLMRDSPDGLSIGTCGGIDQACKLKVVMIDFFPAGYFMHISYFISKPVMKRVGLWSTAKIRDRLKTN